MKQLFVFLLNQAFLCGEAITANVISDFCGLTFKYIENKNLVICFPLPLVYLNMFNLKVHCINENNGTVDPYSFFI